MFGSKVTFDKEYVDDVISYINDILERDPYILYGKLRKKIFSYMVDKRGFSGLPQVMSDDSYADMKTRQYYRGVANIEHLGNILCDYNYHKGVGCYGSGLYFSSNPNVALTFSYVDDNRVISVKYAPDMKLFDRSKYKKQQRQLADYIFDHPQGNQRVMRLIMDDPSKVALALGFDAQQVDAETVTVFNRSKILVREKEYNRILAKCKKYNKDGTINFDQKYEDEYFPDA